MRLTVTFRFLWSLCQIAAAAAECKQYSETEIHEIFRDIYKTNINLYDRVRAKPTRRSSKCGRKADFRLKMQVINDANSQNSSFCLAPNKFTLMDNEEFERGYLGRSKDSPDGAIVELGAKFKIENDRTKRQAPLPSAVSWQGFAGPVDDQNGCGSCWAFAGSHTVSATLSVLKGEYPQDYSEQQIIDCLPNDLDCGPGFAQDVFRYLQNHHFYNDTVYPYISNRSSCLVTWTGGNIPVFGWERTHSFTRVDPQAMLEMVAKRPIVTAFYVTDHFKAYRSGIYYAPPEVDCTSGFKLNHEMTIVGYGTDPVGGDYWLLKNSWGAEWGENGFVRIRRGENVCNIEIDGRYPILNLNYAPDKIITASLVATRDCVDLHGSCAVWKPFCSNNEYVRDNCRLTCGRCTEQIIAAKNVSDVCVDESRQCAYYGSAECRNNTYNGVKQTTKDGVPCKRYDYGTHEWPHACKNPYDDAAPWCYLETSWDYCFHPCPAS